MASAVIYTQQAPSQPEVVVELRWSPAKGRGGVEGLRKYYLQHIHDLQIQVQQKSHNLNRLEAQRNDLNSKVRELREELQVLQEPGSYVGEVVKVMGKSKVLVKEHAPSIIFMDEIDSIGSARMESGSGNSDSEVRRTMLELLNQLDGFEASNKIKVLMAMNRIDILDQALLRPGRIDRKFEFPNPNEEACALISENFSLERVERLNQFLLVPRNTNCVRMGFTSRWDILKIHSRMMNLMRGIDLKKIAEKMNGASGAELKAVCMEAGMFALRERRVHVTQQDFEMALAKVMKKETEKNMSLRKLGK